MTDRPMPRRFRPNRLAPLLALAVSATTVPPLQAAELVLESSAVLKLLNQALFKRDGKLDLQGGPCFAYLQQPSIELKAGRVFIRSHLVSRTGLDVGGRCVGVDLASWTLVSGAPVAREGIVRLEGIRIDQVEDPGTRLLLQSGLVPSLPAALELDVKTPVADMLRNSGLPVQAVLERFVVDGVQAEGNRLTVRFDFRLLAR